MKPPLLSHRPPDASRKTSAPLLVACALLGSAAAGGLGGVAAAQAPEPAAVALPAAASAEIPAVPAGVAPTAPLPEAPPASAAAAFASQKPPPAPASAPARAPRKTASPAAGPPWSSLTAAQRSALRPLQREWAEIDATRKRKWLEVAQRFDQLGPQEQARLHARMAHWARMSPEQRSNARLNFQEAQLLPPQVRQDRWAEYLALSEAERQQFVDQALQPQAKTGRPASRGTIAGFSFAKSNIVPNPLHATAPHPVAPAVVRAGPGATTMPLRQLPQPPRHLQAGLPKIAATPEFVDGKTLAPRVGPQALGVFAQDGDRP